MVITEGEDLTYRIQRPLVEVGAPLRTLIATARADSAGAKAVSGRTLLTPIVAPPVAASSGYTGTVVHYWRTDYQPTELDAALARLAVDRALDAVTTERLAQAAFVQQPTDLARRHRGTSRGVHAGTARALAIAAHGSRAPRTLRSVPPPVGSAGDEDLA